MQAREPYCVHSGNRILQPMSACRVCKHSDKLQAWKNYWTKERCELTDLIRNECAHCLGHKDATEQEYESDREMVSNLLRFNRKVEK